MTTLIITLITVASLTSWAVVKIMNKKENKRMEDFAVWLSENHFSVFNVKTTKFLVHELYQEYLKSKKK